MATRTIAGCLHKAGDKGGNRVQQSGGEDGGVIATVAPVRYMMEAVLPSLSFVSIRQISCREPRAAVASEVRAHCGVLGSREGRALGDDEEGRVDRGAKKRHLVVQKPCLLPPRVSLLRWRWLRRRRTVARRSLCPVLVEAEE